MLIKARVLQIYKVFYPDLFGGIPYIIDAIRKVAPERIEHQVLVCSDKDTTPSTGVLRVHSFGNLFSLPFAPTYPLKLYRALQSVDISILHAPFLFGDLIFGLGMRRNVRLIVFWHSEIIRQKWLLPVIRPLIRRTLRRAESIFVSHPSVIDSSATLEGFRQKISVIPFPIDLSKYELNESDLNEVASLRERYGPRLVVACGRLVSYKGFDILIEAAKKIEAQFVIVGDGVDRESLERQIVSCGLTKRVHLVGSLPHRELICHLHAAHVFAFPSVTSAETFGIAQLEAMACGCPVVNSNLPTAVPHVARDQQEGITVAPGDIGELVAAVEHLLNDPALAKKLGQNGKERVKSDFATADFNQNIEKFLMLHQKRHD